MGHQRQTDLFPANRGQIQLSAIGPTDLHIFRPRDHPIMTAKPKATTSQRGGFQPSPMTDTRILSVCSHQPAAANITTVHRNTIRRDTRDSGTPMHHYAKLRRTVHQNLMESGAPNGQASAMGKTGVDGGV